MICCVSAWRWGGAGLISEAFGHMALRTACIAFQHMVINSAYLFNLTS